MDLYLVIAWVCVGVILGVILSSICRRIIYARAKLIRDDSNPDKVSYTLDVFDFDVLEKKRYLEVKIVDRANSLK